jgi:hypothetical protein
MDNPTKEEGFSPLGCWVTIVLFVVTLPSLGAFWLGWSFGFRGEHKGDEAIRDVLVAVALLALGLIFAVAFMGALLTNIILRLKKLAAQSRQPTDDSKPGA